MIIQKISTANKRKVIVLIQSECCNYMGGDCVAMDLPCAQIKRMRDAEEKEGVSPFVCRWFLDAVLPFDKDLCAAILEPHNLVKCEMCGTMFAPGSNRSKYCEPCMLKDRQKRQREYAQKKRGILSTVRA